MRGNIPRVCSEDERQRQRSYDALEQFAAFPLSGGRFLQLGKRWILSKVELISMLSGRAGPGCMQAQMRLDCAPLTVGHLFSQS